MATVVVWGQWLVPALRCRVGGARTVSTTLRR